MVNSNRNYKIIFIIIFCLFSSRSVSTDTSTNIYNKELIIGDQNYSDHSNFTTVEWGHDNQTLIIGQLDGSIQFQNIHYPNQTQYVIKYTPKKIDHLSVRRDGKYLLSKFLGGYDLWDLAKNEVILNLEYGGAGNMLKAHDWDPMGEELAIQNQEDTLDIIDLTTMEITHTINALPSSVKYSSNGNLLVLSFTEGNTVVFYNTSSWELVKSISLDFNLKGSLTRINETSYITWGLFNGDKKSILILRFENMGLVTEIIEYPRIIEYTIFKFDYNPKNKLMIISSGSLNYYVFNFTDMSIVDDYTNIFVFSAIYRYGRVTHRWNFHLDAFAYLTVEGIIHIWSKIPFTIFNSQDQSLDQNNPTNSDNGAVIALLIMFIGVPFYFIYKIYWGSNKSKMDQRSKIKPNKIVEPNWILLSGYEFEKYIANLLTHLEYKAIKLRKGSGDGGIDITAFDKENRKVAFECKNWQNTKVGRPVVQKFESAIRYENFDKGIIITTSNFTKHAIEYAKNVNIELINGSRLSQIINKK